MAVSATALIEPRDQGFAPWRPWDRNAFLLLVGLVWLGIVVGFGWDVEEHFRTHERAYAPIVHLHAALFVGWLVILTTQVLLIRTHRIGVHRRLGAIAMCLTPAMVIVGLATAWTVQRQFADDPASDPQFISINITDMLGFAGLVGAGWLLRRDSPAHKRLMLLSTLVLSHAGFARWWGFAVHREPGFWPFFDEMFVGANVLVLLLGAYDLVTRRRLHPAYVAGACWILANEVTAAWLFVEPWWKTIAIRLIGH